MLHDPEAKVLAVSAVLLIAVGTVAYMLIEHWTLLQAVYFCVVTLGTVGYGDLYPTTDLGQLFTIFYIIGGLGIAAAFISELAKHRSSPALAVGIARVEERDSDAAAETSGGRGPGTASDGEHATPEDPSR